MTIMKKKELITEIAASTTCTQAQVNGVLRELARVTLDAAMDGCGVPIPGIGRIVIRPTKSRLGRNINTGEEMAIPAGSRPVFRPSKALRHSAEHAFLRNPDGTPR
jgi:DNA-binding protein HU-beta